MAQDMQEAATLQLPGYITTQHYIDGVLYPKFIEAEYLEKLKRLKLRPKDVFIMTFPKSGTHWVMKIVYLILHNGEDQYLHSTPSREQFMWIEHPEYREGIQEVLPEEMPDPRLFASHFYYKKTAGGPPNTSPAKYIYCARNPKDVATALYHHHVQRKETYDNIDFDLSWGDFLKHFLRGEVSFGSWWDTVPEWWVHRHEPNVLFLKYEDLKKDLPANVKTIADFLGRNLDQDTIQKIAQATTIDSMRANTTEWKKYYLRKGVVGDWKNHFTPAQSEALDALYLKTVEGTGLEMEFE